jgi:hypothetical protein
MLPPGLILRSGKIIKKWVAKECEGWRYGRGVRAPFQRGECWRTTLLSTVGNGQAGRRVSGGGHVRRTGSPKGFVRCECGWVDLPTMRRPSTQKGSSVMGLKDGSGHHG